MQFSEICLFTHFFDKQKQFYTKILEIALEEELENRFSLRAGSTLLTFAKAKPSQEPFYHFAFNIPENKFSEAKDWLKGRVQLIKSRDGEDEFDFRNWNAHAMYFFDPAGNIVEFIARHDLPNRSNRHFAGSSLLNVSEIGIVVNDVAAYSAELMKVYDVGVYRNTSYPNFAALGDANGLFIVVSENRKWYPGGPASQIFPLSTTLKGSSNHIIKPAKFPYSFEMRND